jgi:hypothetical protein
LSIIDFCGLASAGRIVFDLPPPNILGETDGLFFGFGGRVGHDVKLGAQWFARVYGDLVVQGRRTALEPPPEVATPVQTPYWQSPSLLITIGAAIGTGVSKGPE